MNLSKRAALLIFPVIAAGYSLAALQVYSTQSHSITRLEQTRLDNRLIELKSSFDSYQSFVDGFILNVSTGDKLRIFLQQSDDAYRMISLRNSIDRYVSGFQKSNMGVASFAVLNPRLETEYYFEDSTDPFSSISQEQLEFAEQLFNQGHFEGNTHKTTDNKSRIIHARVLNSSTFKRPLRISSENSVLLMTSIEPVMYDRLIAETRNEYNASITYLATPPDSAATLSSWKELKLGYILYVAPDAAYLTTLKSDLRSWLILAVLILSISTFGLLILLIRKFITQPVSKLDYQLEQVMQKRLHNIDKPAHNDEISRLGIRFYELYEKLSHMLEQTREMSRNDALTGLGNRAAFTEIANHRLTEASRNKESLVFIYVDLDNFKFVNDKYGHDTGDNLLRAFSNKMLALLGIHQSPTAWMNMFRLSGDEFAIVVQGLVPDQIEEFLLKVLSLFEHGFHFEQGTFPVTASLGIAFYPENGHTVTQLISNADLAMYQAKHLGKNRYAFYSPEIAEQSRRQVAIEEQLNMVDPDEEFYLVYMPIVDRENRCVSCEVLLRWESPVLGNVSPAEFIPIAETSGHFVKIDYWVIEEAIAMLPQVRSNLDEHIKLSINISSAQLGSTQIRDYTNRVLEKYETPGSAIELEITETYNLEQKENILDRLNIFLGQEFTIAIDDFGVGNTSLMQLVDSPINKIKLDRSFIDRVARTHKDQMISAFINLCHIQNIKVTAEGIENAEQSHLLLNAGCDYFQGYYISKPISLLELAEYREYQYTAELTPALCGSGNPI